jgi:hypothetical protein
MSTGAGLPRYEVVKTYPPRGPLAQFRLAKATAFPCFRCGRPKVSKLITVLREDWTHLLCNGCYGRLIAVHEIRSGTDTDESKANAIVAQLLELVTQDEKLQMEALLRLRHKRSSLLDARSLRMLATSTYVAEQLSNATDLDWSAAVIGLCKAFENELTLRLVEPLAQHCTDDASGDLVDKDLGRIAAYCIGRTPKPPEIGVVTHFLQTAANSESRRETSPVLRALRDVLRHWPHSDWLLASDGAVASMTALTTEFRNRAAHSDLLKQDDYDACAHLVTGDNGLLWKLLSSTQA